MLYSLRTPLRLGKECVGVYFAQILFAVSVNKNIYTAVIKPEHAGGLFAHSNHLAVGCKLFAPAAEFNVRTEVSVIRPLHRAHEFAAYNYAPYVGACGRDELLV